MTDPKQAQAKAHGDEAAAPTGDARLAERLSQARHDLRNPLSGILGFSEILIEEAKDACNTSWIHDFERINRAASEMLRAINEHLNPEALLAEPGSLERLRTTICTLAPEIAGTAKQVGAQTATGTGGTLKEDLARIAVSARQIPELFERLVPDTLVRDIWKVRQDVHDRGRTQSAGALAAEAPHNSEGHREAVHAGAEQDAAPAGHVLVVDDSESNRVLLSRTLARAGYRVTNARQGGEALDLLHSCPFDVVLLDIVMPGIDGYEVLTQLKREEPLRHLPVIMISALDDLASLVRCIEGGADDYLTKPFDPVLLRARIGACLEKKRLRDKERALLEQLQHEQAKSETLLLNILPRPIAERLKRGEQKIVDSFADVSVLFADLVGFSSLFKQMAPSRVVDLLNEIFSAFDLLAQERGLEKIKTIGDAYMVVGGLPVPLESHAEAIAELALEMQRTIRDFNRRYGTGVQLRIGIDTGPCIAGIIGRNKFIYDLWGDSVNTASRMESQGQADCIQITRTTRDRLSARYVLEERGILDIKGKGAMPVYWLKAKK